MKKFKQLRKTIFATALAVVCMLSPFCEAQAAATTTNVSGNVKAKIEKSVSPYTSTQGMAVGEKYYYVCRTTDSTSDCNIVRIARDGSGTKLMTYNKKTNLSSLKLGHANSMILAKINGDNYMYILTLDKTLLQLKYNSSAQITNVKTYSVPSKYSAIAKIATSGTKINIYLQSRSSGDLIYTKGTIDTKASSVNISSDKIKISNIVKDSNISTQSFFVNGSTLYIPLWNKNNPAYSHIYEYKISGSSASLKKDLYLTDSNCSKFEIESASLYDGKLYFNTNGETRSSNGQYDRIYKITP